MRSREIAAVAEALLRLLDGGDMAAAPRAARPADEPREGRAAYRTAEDAASRTGPYPDVPEEETVSPAAARRGGRNAARRREGGPEPPAQKPRRAANGEAADELLRSRERRRLGAALEALSDGRLRAGFPGPERIEGNGSPDAADGGGQRSGAAAVGDAAARGGGRDGAAARSPVHFPSSGAYSGDDPEAVSEFFRRDSRRYDAAFGGG